MRVEDVINTIQDIDLAIVKVEDNKEFEENDKRHIVQFLTDYKNCLKSREVIGTFDRSN